MKLVRKSLVPWALSPLPGLTCQGSSPEAHASGYPLCAPSGRRNCGRPSGGNVWKALVCFIVVATFAVPLLGQAQPTPKSFDTGYQIPTYQPGPPRADWLEWVDVAVLAAALVLSALLAHVWRWRRGLLLLAIMSLAYFGFYRRGCVCAIGAIQNITAGLADPHFAVPLPVIAFFVLPLAMALVAGRAFCGAVCPLGAIQEIVVLRPLQMPAWLERPLRMLAWIYLAAAVLFAATGAAFVICQFDPFVAFFRLSGEAAMLVLGAAVLVFGVFVGRPYCRFFCPMGVLLREVSRWSAWRVKVTREQCIRCRLCEQSCPYGAIRKPTPQAGAPRHIRQGRTGDRAGADAIAGVWRRGGGTGPCAAPGTGASVSKPCLATVARRESSGPGNRQRDGSVPQNPPAASRGIRQGGGDRRRV